MINKFLGLYGDYKLKNADSGFLGFVFYLWQGFIKVLSAKIYLRTCQSVGSRVSVNKKPLLVNKGKMYVADEVRIWSNINRAKIFVEKGGELTIGRNSRINGCHISVSQKVTIGNNVRIAPYVIIIDDDYHDVADHFAETSKKGAITIEDDVWLAMCCKVMKGVTIGRGSVVAMGALVTKDVPPYTVVAGVPAKVIKQIPH